MGQVVLIYVDDDFGSLTYFIIHVTNTCEEINFLPLYSSNKCVYKINSY